MSTKETSTYISSESNYFPRTKVSNKPDYCFVLYVRNRLNFKCVADGIVLLMDVLVHINSHFFSKLKYMGHHIINTQKHEGNYKTIDAETNYIASLLFLQGYDLHISWVIKIIPVNWFPYLPHSWWGSIITMYHAVLEKSFIVHLCIVFLTRKYMSKTELYSYNQFNHSWRPFHIPSVF